MESEKNVDLQNQLESEPSPTQNSQTPTPPLLFMLFCYLYFVQGAIMGIVGTMPYIYPALPDVHTMAIFNAVGISYSLKFLFAPILERHSSIDYGKRKTWIIISQLLTGSVLFFSAFYTQMQFAKLFAVMCMIMMIGMVLQNIALHSLIVKEIPCPSKSSLIQSFAEVVGILVGGLILLKLTSLDFATSIGLKQPITHPKTVLITFCCIILIPLTLIHFNFQERTLESQKKGSKFSFCQIISYYKVFTQPKTKYFRFCVLALIYNQGVNFFNSLYQYQMVKSGFSRDTLNTISNIAIIPIIVLTFSFRKWTNAVGGNFKVIFIVKTAVIVFDIFMLQVAPRNPWIVGMYVFLDGLFDAWDFFVIGVMINQFPIHALSGMYITLLGSFVNFGNLTFIHTQLCGVFGWKMMAWIGIGLQIIILVFLKRIFVWMENGQEQVDPQIREPNKQEVKHRELQEVDMAIQ